MRFVVLIAVALAAMSFAQRDWDVKMSEIRVKCGDPAASQDRIPFAGFKDECDNTDKIIYEPADSRLHLDLVIDPRNANDVQWDTARYKRYGTYYPTANVTWHVPAGFSNLWARVYYANDNDKKFGGMVYKGSIDGQIWTDVPNLVVDQNVENSVATGWYKKKEESASWPEPFFYLKAIFPAPCAGEIGATYAADQRRCLSLPPPGWTGTIEQFDASPLKDLYYTPQLGEIILGTSPDTPGRPANFQIVAGLGSIKASWDPPAGNGPQITSYTLYYQVDSPLVAADPEYKPPYLAKYVNLGLRTEAILTGLDPARTYIVRVAANGRHGAGPSTPNLWTPPSGTETFQCSTIVPTLGPTDAPETQTNAPNPSVIKGTTNPKATSAAILSVPAQIGIPLVLVGLAALVL